MVIVKAKRKINLDLIKDIAQLYAFFLKGYTKIIS